MTAIFYTGHEDNVQTKGEDEHLNQLRAELEELLQKKKLNQVKIKEISEEIAEWEDKAYSVECSFSEAKRIANEMENAARVKAEQILADAEAVMASRKSQMLLIEKEMVVLQEELDSYNREDQTAAILEEDDFNREEKAENLCNSSVEENQFDVKKNRKSTKSESIYNMKVITFLNARHFVTFDKKTGPVHAHSWQVEIEVAVSPDIDETVAFSKLFKAVSEALSIYENTILNQVYPFDKLQPTTENISMYFYNRMEDALAELGLGLIRLNLWETPTKGIEVNNRNTAMDNIMFSNEEFLKTYEQAAIASDINLLESEEEEETPEVSVRRSLEAPEVFLRPVYSIRQYLFAALLISIVGILAYHNILWPPIEQHYPWGSDSWGHLFKAENLYYEILKGNYYPQFTEYWYNGSQPFRYWAPLPYYALALLMAATGEIFSAGNLYIFLCALFGALSWLFMSRRMGLWPAVMAGMIWLIWQDNVRVAFSEGNLPRVLATALLPLLFFLFLHTIQNRKSYKGLIAMVIMIHLVILCHAMMGAIYCICLALFGFFLWVFRGCNLPNLFQAILGLLLGIISSGWWLLPSLTGGITNINVQAVKEIIQFVSAEVSLNPFCRLSNIETFYWGLALLAGLLMSIITWKSKPAWAKSAVLTGIILIIITFPLVRGFYIILPLSHLLWPLRFSSFAALMVLVASFTFNLAEHRQKWFQSPYFMTTLIMALFLMQMADCFVSFRLLAHTGTRPFNIIQTADFIKEEPGWRVATIDLSQLGSAPSYTFSQTAGLEQVFGWAWQGAVTSRNIMLLNTGLENQYYPFLFRSCVDLGATDLVVKEDVITDSKAFRRAAMLAGYEKQDKFGEIGIWRSIDSPYMIEKETTCLVIGKFAGTVALQFPAVEMGLSPYIDKYSADKLKEYPMLILSGATWKSKSRAEGIIKEYLDYGGKVFVELAGMPENILARQPEFLDVYGEPISMRDEIEVWGKDRRLILSPVRLGEKDWRAYVPMELDSVELEFSYYGNQAPILGYKMVNKHKVWFLGNNIIYYTFLTGDPDSLDLLQDIFGLDTSYKADTLIPLQDYEASENGYRMTYSTDREKTVIVPIAVLDGIKVELDGEKIEAGNFENLLELRLPAGKHDINIYLEKTPIYKWGMTLSLLAIVLLAAGFFYVRKTDDELL